LVRAWVHVRVAVVIVVVVDKDGDVGDALVDGG